jgi:hypothetical protein
MRSLYGKQHPRTNIIWDKPFNKLQPYEINLKLFLKIHLPTFFYAPKVLPL